MSKEISDLVKHMRAQIWPQPQAGPGGAAPDALALEGSARARGSFLPPYSASQVLKYLDEQFKDNVIIQYTGNDKDLRQFIQLYKHAVLHEELKDPQHRRRRGEAIDLVERNFEACKHSNIWSGLDPIKFMFQLLDHIREPKRIIEGRLGCGEIAAYVMHLAKFESPIYAQNAIDLFVSGKSTLKQIPVEPNQGFRTGYVRSGAYNHRLGECNYVVVGAIRNCPEFLQPTLAAASKGPELCGWLRKVGFTEVQYREASPPTLTRGPRTPVQIARTKECMNEMEQDIANGYNMIIFAYHKALTKWTGQYYSSDDRHDEVRAAYMTKFNMTVNHVEMKIRYWKRSATHSATRTPISRILIETFAQDFVGCISFR